MIGLMDLMGEYARRRPASGNQRFMPYAPFGIPGHPQSTGGYDSSGINPRGMYTGGLQQRFPANPGGFMAMMGRY